MNLKPKSYRMCVISREILLKEELFRIVSTPNGVEVDLTHKKKGRGVYIKKDLKTIEAAYKKNALSKALKKEVKEEIYLELVQALSKERR